jgi:hypothetical protein
MRKLAAGLLLVFVLIPAGNAAGLNTTVGCAGGTPGIHSSIGAAIAAASAQPQNHHLILVSGTCTENLQVHDFSNLNIVGSPAATILDAGTGTPSSVPAIVFAAHSRLTLENLTIGAVGPGAPFVPVIAGGGGTNSISITRCTLQGGSFPGGLWLHGDSTVLLQSTIIQDNVNNGVRVDAGADLVIVEATPPHAPTIIQRNSNSGVGVSDGGRVLLREGGNLIQNNGTGINSSGGHVFLCCDSGSKILNNRVGIRANGGTVRVNSEFEISGNSIAGVLLTGANAALTSGIYRNNGSAADITSGGVIAEGSSHVDLFNSDVSDNLGSGLVLRDNSSARVFNNLVQNNGGSGIRVMALSTASLFGGIAAAGNANYDLFCTPNAYASGDASGFNRKFCPGFDQSPAPKGGGSPEP